MAEYQIVDSYAGAGIPLETFVSDSQYMDHNQDFTLGATFPLGEMQALWRACTAAASAGCAHDLI